MTFLLNNSGVCIISLQHAAGLECLGIMNDHAYWYLENIDVTGIFCPEKIRASGNEIVHKNFPRGTYIYMPDDLADRIFFIVEGRVKIGAYGDNGKEVTKAILGKGEVFGELAVISDQNRRDFAYAMDDTMCCAMAADDMKQMIRNHSDLSVFFMKLLGSRTLKMEQRLESLVFKDSRARVIEFILNMLEKYGERVGYEWVIRKFVTHQEIANMTATSRQTVTTILNELRNADLIKFNRKRLPHQRTRSFEKRDGELSRISYFWAKFTLVFFHPISAVFYWMPNEHTTLL